MGVGWGRDGEGQSGYREKPTKKIMKNGEMMRKILNFTVFVLNLNSY